MINTFVLSYDKRNTDVDTHMESNQYIIRDLFVISNQGCFKKDGRD